MDIKVYDLPLLEEENVTSVTKHLMELERRYRNAAPMDEIEIDWMDSANNWLLFLD